MYRFDFDVRQFRNITTYACSNRKISVIKDKTLLRKDTCEQRSFIRICHWQHIFNQLGAAWSIAKWTTTLAAHIMSKSNLQETAQDSTLPDGGMTLGPTWESQVCFKGGAVWLWHGRGNNIWAQPTIYLPVGCWHISLSSSHCLCRDPSVIVRTSVPAFTHLVLSAAAKPVLSADGSDWHNNMLLTHIKKLTDKAAVSGRRPKKKWDSFFFCGTKKKWDSVLCCLVPRMIDETFMDLVLQGNWCSFLRNK